MPPPTSSNVVEYRVAILEKEIGSLRTELRQLQELVDRQQDDRNARERNVLVAGIALMGSVMLSLIGVIWAYRALIFK